MVLGPDRDLHLPEDRDGEADGDTNSLDGSEFSDDSSESTSSSMKAEEFDMFRMKELNDVLMALEDTVYPTTIDILNTFEDEPSEATISQPGPSANTLIDLAGFSTNVELASLLTKNEPQIYTEPDEPASLSGVMMSKHDGDQSDVNNDNTSNPSSWTPFSDNASTYDVNNDSSQTTDIDIDSFFVFDDPPPSSSSSTFVFEATPPQAPYANDRRDPFIDMAVLPKDTLSSADSVWTTPREFIPSNMRTMSSREARLAAQASRPGPVDPRLRFSPADFDMVKRAPSLRGPFRETMKEYRQQLAEAGEEVSDWEDSSIDDDEIRVPRMVDPLPPREDRRTAPLPRRALNEG